MQLRRRLELRRSSGGGTSWCLFATGNSLWRFDPVKRINKEVIDDLASTATGGWGGFCRNLPCLVTRGAIGVPD